MAKRVTSRQLQAAATKRRIYECAMELFDERGYHRVTVEEIASQANVSVGGFYYHFASKDELSVYFLYQLDEVYQRFYGEAQQDPKYTPDNTFTLFRDMMLHGIERMTQHGREFTSVIYYYLFRDSDLGRDTTSRNRLFYQIVRELYQDWERRDLLIDGLGIEELYKNISILFRGCVVDWCIVDTPQSIREHSEFLIDLFVGAIQKKP